MEKSNGGNITNFNLSNKISKYILQIERTSSMGNTNLKKKFTQPTNKVVSRYQQ